MAVPDALQNLKLKMLEAQQRYVDEQGRPTLQFQMHWQETMNAIMDTIAALVVSDSAQDDLLDEILAAQTAAAAANAAAAAANTAAANAQSAADDVTETQELATSYVSGATITATDVGADVTITISAHTRNYPQPDGSVTSVAVNGGSLTGRNYSTSYFIYYDDPARTGGAVTYQSTTSEATAAQVGDRHTVGSVITPAALGAPSDGRYVRPPGPGAIP